ncbi:hypothetical protein MLD38_005555 [Melastoma candidum]|uniref:Uncharacterized protein n=1 Tax=Melastoma candidum TaxID=119954 RepID=A0ACB9RJE1_9MYRT|nr:hypothetical protein MLD38_005555 [Melastoma candidum]
MATTTPFGGATMINDAAPRFLTIIPNYALPSHLKPNPNLSPLQTLPFSPTPSPSPFPANRFPPCRVSSPDPPPPGDPIPALADLLCRDYGLTEEEALGIVSRAPGYVAMVLDGVRELDEVPPSFFDGSTFEEKVARMARRRNDGGKVAFFESLGMSPTSALNVSRYLSSHSLPHLLRKVRVVKEMLFSSSDPERTPLGKLARRMMSFLSIPVDEDVQQTLSFFEKIEARRGGLDMLDNQDLSFQYLVESFPRILSLSTNSHLKPMVDLLISTGIPPDRVRNVLLLFPPMIFYDIEDIKQKILVCEKALGDNLCVGRMILKYPWIFSTSIQTNLNQILLFFEMEKIPESSVSEAIGSWPYLLGCSTIRLKSMIERFYELNIRKRRLGKIISSSPQLLARKPENFYRVVSVFEDLGFDTESIGQIVARCPEIFASSIETTLKKKLEFLDRIGISKEHLPRVIKKYPEVLVSDVDKTVTPRIRYLMEAGLTRKEIAFMVRKFSPLLGYSIDEVFKPKLEFLVNTMGKPLAEIVEYPRYFSYSLEGKIKPRYQVLKGKTEQYSLKDMLGKNNEEFAIEFMDMGNSLVSTNHFPNDGCQ